MQQIQLSFYVYYSGTEVNGKSARIRKELGLQNLVLMCKLNNFLPSAMDQKCGLSQQRLKGRGGLSEVMGSRLVFDGKGKSCALHLNYLPVIAVTIFYPYKILSDSSGKFMRMAEVNHETLAIVNNLQETAGVQRVLCEDLC